MAVTPAHVFWCLAKEVGLAAGTGMPASLWEEILAANQSRSMSGSGGGCCRCSAELCLSRSAGIGRTGCFIATRIGCQQLKEKGEVDILGIVCHLRIDRWVLRAGWSWEGAAGCQAWEDGRDTGGTWGWASRGGMGTGLDGNQKGC